MTPSDTPEPSTRVNYSTLTQVQPLGLGARPRQDSQQKHEFDPQIASYWQSVQEEQDQYDIRR